MDVRAMRFFAPIPTSSNLDSEVDEDDARVWGMAGNIRKKPVFSRHKGGNVRFSARKRRAFVHEALRNWAI
jgi:hypothetical protein